jgi:hypothetical protein
MNTQECFQNHPKLSPLDKKHTQNFANVKSCLQDQQSQGLEKVCRLPLQNFPLEEIRITVVTHQTSTENNSQKKLSLIEYGREQFVTHIITHHNLTSHSGQKHSHPFQTNF